MAQGQAPSSISSRISDASRVETHYGDLDEAFDRDEFAGLLGELVYTGVDRVARKPNPTRIVIDGDVYDGLSSARSALTAYRRFRAEGGSESATQADRIRQYVVDNVITPARQQGEKTVELVSGDVHRALALENAMPAVCSALGGRKLQQLADVTIAERRGPENSSTVLFRFDLTSQSPAGWAEAELRRRYGAPITDTDKMIAFALSNGRELALQRDLRGTQIWVEDDPTRPAPPSQQVRHYLAEQARHSNLPARLRHFPPAGAAPRGVALVTIDDLAMLSAVLDWYERWSPVLNRAELERMRDIFLERFPTFQTFERPGGFAAEEDNYKRALIARAEELVEQTGSETSALGSALLDLLAGQTNLQSNLLGWRMADGLAKVRAAHPGVLEAAAGQLVRAGDAIDGVGKFVQAAWPSIAEGKKGSLPYGDSRTIPTMLAALVRPNDVVGVRSEPFRNASLALLGRAVFANGPLDPEELRGATQMARGIFGVMRDAWGWHPRDLWDVQGFIWVTCQKKLEHRQTPSDAATADSLKDVRMPTNLILYGPPGTGKTFSTAREAVRLCDGALPGDEEALRLRYLELTANKQVQFVTFHQSYSYEDFVEGLRPTTGDGGDDTTTTGAGFRLVPVAGIFREIATLAEEAQRSARSGESFDLAGRRVFKMSLGRAGVEDHIFEAAIDGGYAALGWGGDVDWASYESYEAIHAKWNELHPGTNGNDANIVQTARFRVDMRVGDLIVVSYGNHRFRAIGEVIGPYQYEPSGFDNYDHRRAVRWIRVFEEPLPVETIYDRPFIQWSCYLLQDRHLNRDALAMLLPGGGAGEAAEPRQFVLIIDEINRANISKVFGELITLIEPDKRLEAPYELKVTLPYSKASFGIPANLHIVGTMNTADRSIALLDTALRRRFEFRELMPDPRALASASTATGIDLSGWLTALNDRIEYLFDREHQIGHAYFIKCNQRDGPGGVDDVMRHKIIPLLAEYFYEDWGKVADVLGGRENNPFLEKRKLTAPPGLDGELGEDRFRWNVRESFYDDAYPPL